jgi:hypothetical protein
MAVAIEEAFPVQIEGAQRAGEQHQMRGQSWGVSIPGTGPFGNSRDVTK